MDLPCADEGKTWTLSKLLEGVAYAPPSDGHNDNQGFVVRRLVGLTNAHEAGDLCFFADSKLFAQLLALPSGVLCLISPEHARLARTRGVKAALVETEDAKQAWRLMVERVVPAFEVREHAIHPSAIVEAGAILHEPICLGAYSVVEEGVEIGAGTRIASHCLVQAGTRVGKNCRIGAGTIVANADLADGVVLHERCLIGGEEFGIVRDEQHIPHNFPQLGRVSIGAHSEIFKGTTIGRATMGETKIGKHVKIGCQSLISHNCQIGDYTILSPRCGLAGSTRIGHYVTIGASMEAAQGVVIGDRVGIGGGCIFWSNITIGDGVQIMNASFVERSLKGDGVIFFGRPARPLREELRRRKKIDRLIG